MFNKNKKGLMKLLAFGVIMIILSAGLGTMLMAQSTVSEITENFLNSSVSAETKARVEAHTNPIDFRDYNKEINVVILAIIVIFFAYAIWSSYLNDVNNFQGVFNFFLLIVLLSVTGYLANVHSYIWSMPLFSGVELEYSAIVFYFANIGKINLIVGILISILTVAPKERKETVDPVRFG